MFKLFLNYLHVYNGNNLLMMWLRYFMCIYVIKQLIMESIIQLDNIAMQLNANRLTCIDTKMLTGFLSTEVVEAENR